ncbi:MAG: phosphoglucosamine mutase [Thermoplasmata archaeon]|nr:phosphoglucosamine mutase [Thermoplasmata archaeon]
MTRLFGTNGIRWQPDKVDDHNFAIELGLAIGTYFGEGKTICLGMDTRVTGPMIFSGVVSGILSTGCDIIDIGVVPTPTVQFGVRTLKADGGVMITASHNPPEFNGLKCIDHDGTEMARVNEEKIENIYFSKAFHVAAWNAVGDINKNNEMIFRHIQHILSIFKPKDGQKPLKVVVDCSNGPAGDLTPYILRTMGCEVITLNAQPDGMFPGRMPEPLEKNLQGLMKAVTDTGADLGIAHDGDADRATFIDEKGNYVNGDESLALFVIDTLKSRKGKVVVPVNTSRKVIDSISSGGGELELTPIGSPIIARRMGNVNAIIGGEGNGGVIFPENMLCRDGMMTAARMVEVLANNDKTLSQMVSDLPEYYIMRSKYECPDNLKAKVLDRVKEISHDLDILDIDGVKIEEENWWVLFRPSGTEPIFRVTTEAKDTETAQLKLNEYKAKLKKIIEEIE